MGAGSLAADWWRPTRTGAIRQTAPADVNVSAHHVIVRSMRKEAPDAVACAGSILKAFLEKSGAGEGIRTLDPNLGKVVLYP